MTIPANDDAVEPQTAPASRQAPPQGRTQAAASPLPPPSPSGDVAPSFTFEPLGQGNWVRPRYAAIVVSIVALALLGVVSVALLELAVGKGPDGGSVADPNASTIAAIASAAIACLTSLTAAYFGVKVASEQSAQANATAGMALEVASKVAAGNSTANGNPSPGDF